MVGHLATQGLHTLVAPRAPAGSNQGVLFLMLSLQLLLISFFILLNTMATPKQNRQHSAPPNLTGFAGVDNHNGTGQHQATWDTGPMQVVQVHQQLTGLVQTIFRLTTPPLTTVATQATVSIPFTQLYTSTHTLTSSGQAFFTNLLSLASTNTHWQVTITLGQTLGLPPTSSISRLLASHQSTTRWPPNVALRIASGPAVATFSIYPGSTPNPRSINQLDRTIPAGSTLLGQ